MLRTIFCILIFIKGLFCQDIYFQHNNKLSINNEVVKITYQNNTYNIFSGIVSLNGNFIYGYLIDKKINSFLQSINRNEIVDFIDVDSLQTIIYDRKKNKIIYKSLSKSFFKGYFSDDEKYILISRWPIEESKLINLNMGILEYNFPIIYQNFKWVKGNLYFLKNENSNYEICYFDIGHVKIVPIAKISNELLEDKEIIQTKILDVSRIVILSKDNSGNYLTVVDDNLIIKEIKFKVVTEVGAINKNTILIIGKQCNEEDAALFNFELSNNCLHKIFTIKELECNVINFPVTNISNIFQLNDEFYFLNESILPEFKNFIKFNLKNLTFSTLTENGYVSEPIGYFK